MTNEQYTAIMKMFDGLADLRQEMATEFVAARQEIATGFEYQSNVSKGIQEGAAMLIQKVENDILKTKKEHDRRLRKVERHLGFA